MKHLQVPEHTYTAKMGGLELLIYADVWTMQKAGREYWKSNQTIADKFGVHRTTVIRALNRLTDAGHIERNTSKPSRTRRHKSTRPDEAKPINLWQKSHNNNNVSRCKVTLPPPMTLSPRFTKILIKSIRELGIPHKNITCCTQCF